MNLSVFLVVCCFISFISTQTTTPDYVYRTNPNFGGETITTPEELQGTLVTDTRVTTTSSTSTSTSTSTTSTTSTSITKPAAITQTDANPPNTDPATFSTPTNNGIYTSTSTSTFTSSSSTLTPVVTPGPETTPLDNPNVIVSTIWTTMTIPWTSKSTIYSTIVQNQSPITLTSIETRVYETPITTQYGQLITSVSTSTTVRTIPGSTVVNNLPIEETNWSQVINDGTLILPIPYYSFISTTTTNTKTSTITKEYTKTFETFVPSTKLFWNQTLTTFIPEDHTLIEIREKKLVIIENVINCETFIGTSFTTFSLSDDFWIGQSTTFNIDGNYIQSPITETELVEYPYIYGDGDSITTIFDTVTEYIPYTTVTITNKDIITEIVTEYIQNDVTISPISTVTITLPIETATITAEPITATTSLVPQATVTITKEPPTIEQYQPNECIMSNDYTIQTISANSGSREKEDMNWSLVIGGIVFLLLI